MAVRDAPDGAVDVVLADGTYDLRMGLVRVAPSEPASVGGPAATDERYLVTVSGDGRTVTQGGSTVFVAAVRDAYNNPVPGVRVEVGVPPGNGTLGPKDGGAFAVSDERGQVSFVYDAPENVTGLVPETTTLSLPTVPGPAGSVEYDVTVEGPPSPVGGPGTPDVSPPYLWSLEATADDTAGQSKTAEQVTFVYDAADDVAVDHVQVAIDYVTANGRTTVATRDQFPAASVPAETVGLHGTPDLNGASKYLEVTVTVTDAAGHTRTCVGVLQHTGDEISKDGAVTANAASGYSEKFVCNDIA